MTHIQVKHVKKEWGDVSLFDDITFSVAYGEHIGIVGANGSGKRILQATGLSKSFGDIRLFSDSDFSIARGEKVALFGPNGCEKSTLVSMIEGHLPPDSG